MIKGDIGGVREHVLKQRAFSRLPGTGYKDSRSGLYTAVHPVFDLTFNPHIGLLTLRYFEL
jgi:hypothetical protein